MQLDVAVDSLDERSQPSITFAKERKPGMLGEGLVARVEIKAGETISFILRDDKTNHVADTITTEILDNQQLDTLSFWHSFIAQSKYKGRWMEVVSRSLMILKMMTFGRRTFCACYCASLTKSQSLLAQSSRHRRFLSQSILEEAEIGTTDTAGSETRASPYIFSFALVSRPKQTPTWSL